MVLTSTLEKSMFCCASAVPVSNTVVAASAASVFLNMFGSPPVVTSRRPRRIGQLAPAYQSPFINSTRLPGGRMLFSCGTGKADRTGGRPPRRKHEVGPRAPSAPVNLLLTLTPHDLLNDVGSVLAAVMRLGPRPGTIVGVSTIAHGWK